MFDKSNTYFLIDLVSLGLLDSDWQTQIIKIAEENSYKVVLNGKSSTSREPENSIKPEIFVVEGDVIFKNLNWLDNLYHNELLEIANKNFTDYYECAHKVNSGININLLKGLNARYEWHVDSNPLTGILFVTTHEEGDGGELIFKLKNETITVYPKSGVFILFDARDIHHTVLPLRKETIRVSIPMNYYIKGTEQNRPDDLDSYIYKK